MSVYWKTCLVPPDHLFLDSAPNIGPLIFRWELDKFKNCWNKSFRPSKILTLLYQQFSNLLIFQRDMSGPRWGTLSNNRWSRGNALILTPRRNHRPTRRRYDVYDTLVKYIYTCFRYLYWCPRVHRIWIYTVTSYNCTATSSSMFAFHFLIHDMLFDSCLLEGRWFAVGMFRFPFWVPAATDFPFWGRSFGRLGSQAVSWHRLGPIAASLVLPPHQPVGARLQLGLTKNAPVVL
jgi:hypothetical protein